MSLDLRNRHKPDFSAAAYNCYYYGLPCCEAKRSREVTRTREAHFGAYKAEIEGHDVRPLTNELHKRKWTSNGPPSQVIGCPSNVYVGFTDNVT
jgi:hypothetical protein